MIIEHKIGVAKSTLPDVIVKADGSAAAAQILTAPNLSYVIGALGLGIRFNVMFARVEFTGRLRLAERDDRNRQKLAGLDGFDERLQAEAYQVVTDALQALGIRQLAGVDDVLMVIARRDEFHPMEDWICGTAWDGEDRFEALAATVSTDSALWPTYLRKWLIQGVEAACGWAYEGDPQLGQVLCFIGEQGAGKTQWFKHLAPGFVLPEAELHLSSTAGRDQQLQVLEWPIVELSEIGGTKRKSDDDALKAFLTRTTDTIRRPYARRALVRPRMTIFGGTVNDVQFLQDITGSRRYWPVKAEGVIDWAHGLDMQQVWAQAWSAWDAGENHFLGAEADAQRAEDAAQFEEVPASVELAEAFWWYHGKELDDFAAMNLTEIRRTIEDSGHIAERKALRRWLEKKIGAARDIEGKQRAWPWPRGAHSYGTKLTKAQAKVHLNWFKKVDESLMSIK